MGAMIPALVDCTRPVMQLQPRICASNNGSLPVLSTQRAMSDQLDMEAYATRR